LDVFLRHYSTAKNTFALGKVVADVIYKHNKNQTYGLEVQLDGTSRPNNNR